MTTTYELTVTPHWSQYDGPRPTSGFGAIETYTFDDEQGAHEAMIEHGFNGHQRYKLLAGQVLSVGGWKYALKTVVTEPADEPRTVTLGELTSRLGLPDHDMSAVLAWTGEAFAHHVWTESEVAEFVAAWRVDKARIIADDFGPAAPLVAELAEVWHAIEPAPVERQFCRKSVHMCTPAVTLTFDGGARRLHWCAEHADDAERYRADADEPAPSEPTTKLTLDMLISEVRAGERDRGHALGVGSLSRIVGAERELSKHADELDARLSRARTLAAAGASGADVLRVLDGIEPTSLPAGVTICNARDFDDIRTDQEG